MTSLVTSMQGGNMLAFDRELPGLHTLEDQHATSKQRSSGARVGVQQTCRWGLRTVDDRLWPRQCRDSSRQLPANLHCPNMHQQSRPVVDCHNVSLLVAAVPADLLPFCTGGDKAPAVFSRLQSLRNEAAGEKPAARYWRLPSCLVLADSEQFGG